MRGMVLFLTVFVIISLLSFIALSTNNSNNNNRLETKNTELEFKTFTSAVCDNSEELVKCRDELFVNCNGKISKAAEVAECNGVKIESLKISGFAVFGKEWKDPRI